MPFCPLCFKFITDGTAKRHKHKGVVMGTDAAKKQKLQREFERNLRNVDRKKK